MGKSDDITWMQKENREQADFFIKEHTLIIQFNQDVDHHNAIWIREQADHLLEVKNVKNIIFDFTRVTFMDSSGIGIIMGRYKKVIFIGGKIAVCGVSETINRILSLSGLYKIMECYPSLNEALKSV
ncbi:MAG: anti-sigma F factor antagonist [Lachnospiraceae bacterium]|nr:anti-sigma F factor antagonist [Lachnospiraceae bacterium]